MPSEDYFATTQWTEVLAAGQVDSERSRAALNALCQTYWYPLYVYARRRGYSSEDAEDLAQGFFARLLRLESLSALTHRQGKFRAFLLAAMNHYMADEWDKKNAAKRAATLTISLDTAAAEQRYLAEPVDHVTPASLFHRQWAITLLDTVLHRLKQEYLENHHAELFEELKDSLSGSGAPHGEVAGRLGMTEGAVRVAAHRLRIRYKELLRLEIRRTVNSDQEAEAELVELRRVLSGELL